MHSYVLLMEASHLFIILKSSVKLNKYLGPIVQSSVSLTSPLRGQLVKCTKYTEIFCCKNERSFAKASHIFSTNNISIFEILMFEILTKR